MPHVKEYGEIGRYSARTQDAIIAHATRPEAVDAGRIGQVILERQIALAQEVREAENRAARAYAAEFLRAQDDIAIAKAMRQDGYDASVPSLAPSGTD